MRERRAAESSSSGQRRCFQNVTQSLFSTIQIHSICLRLVRILQTWWNLQHVLKLSFCIRECVQQLFCRECGNPSKFNNSKFQNEMRNCARRGGWNVFETCRNWLCVAQSRPSILRAGLFDWSHFCLQLKSELNASRQPKRRCRYVYERHLDAFEISQTFLTAVWCCAIKV